MKVGIGKREVVIVAMTQLAAIVGTILALKLFTNLLSVEEFGQLSLGLAIVTGFQMVYSAMSNALLRYFPIARAQSELWAYRDGLARLVRQSVAVPLVLMGVMALALKVMGEPVLVLYFLGVMVAVAAGLHSWAQTVLLALRLRWQILLLTLANYILRPLAVVGALLALGLTADIVLWAYLVVHVLTLLAAQRMVTKAFASLPDTHSWQGAGVPQDYRGIFLSYGAYFLIAGVLVAVVLQADRWLVKGYLGLEELGLYGGMLMIATVSTNLVFSFMSQLMTPVIFHHYGDAQQNTHAGMRAYRAFVLISTAIFALMVVMIALLREPIVLILTSETYLPAAPLLTMLAAAQSIEKMGQSITLRGFVALRTWPYLWSRAVQLAVLVGVGVYAIGTLGILGIAWAQLLASGAFILVVWITNRLVTRPHTIAE